MRISFHRNFEKRFAKLDHKIKRAFLTRKDLLIADFYHPLLNNHKLGNEWSGYRSINITGDYRAIFVLKDEDMVEFFAIGTHHELYGL